jgi:hypothetical protein
MVKCFGLVSSSVKKKILTKDKIQEVEITYGVQVGGKEKI